MPRTQPSAGDGTRHAAAKAEGNGVETLAGGDPAATLIELAEEQERD